MGRTNLHKAAFDGNAERVKELLKKGADPNARDKYGWTPLHKAASRCSVDVVKLLLERKPKRADPNIKNKYGTTPLHTAAYEGRVEVVELLLVYGADPTVKDKDRRTPLDLARAEGHSKVVSVIEEWLRRGGGPSRRRF
jgi:serine/threonine-protein kinase TNNI3K